MTVNNTGFLFELVLTFDMTDSLQTCLDLGSFPYLKHIVEGHLSEEQCQTAKRLHRKLSKEKPKLVASLEKYHRITDFTASILYLLVWKNMKIVSIESIVAFKAYDYLRPYIEGLQLARKNATSPLLGKCYKSLGTNIKTLPVCRHNFTVHI